MLSRLKDGFAIHSRGRSSLKTCKSSKWYTLLEVKNTRRCSLSEEQSASNSKRAFVYWLSEFNDLVPDVFWRNLPTHDSVVQSTKCNISDAAAGGNYCRKRNCQRGAIILSLFAQRVVALGRCNYSLIMLHISFLTCQSCKFLVSTQQQQLDRDSKLEPMISLYSLPVNMPNC